MTGALKSLFHGQSVACLAAYSLIEERQGDVFESVFIIDEVERLEHESDEMVPEFSGTVLAQIVDKIGRAHV